MKTKFLTIAITICLLASTFSSFAQNVGINNTGAAPDNSALLDLSATDKGFLITRVDTASIATPAFGLMTLAPSDSCLYMFSGTSWIGLGGVGNSCTCSCSNSVLNSLVFTYTGAPQTFTVPPGITTIIVEVLGAQGGGAFGGNGGRSIATIPVTPGEVINVYVGENPTVQIGSGWNGGGSVMAIPCGGALDGWPGGGASDIRRAPYALANRLIVGGGGGGQGYSNGAGGTGGGLTGSNGGVYANASVSTGGTQVTGGNGGVIPNTSGCYTGTGTSPSGTLGIGGNAGPTSTCCGGGAGGGGYYGGGGGYVASGAGGSSRANFPGNTATSTTPGVNPGNGQVTISW